MEKTKAKRKKKWQKQDFELLRKKGLKIRQRGFFLIYRKNQLAFSRLAFAFSRRTGNAVQRNRFKRWGRHFLREQKKPFNMDLIMGFEHKKKEEVIDLRYETFYLRFKNLYKRIQ